MADKKEVKGEDVDPMVEIKKVVSHLLDNFLKTEAGNKVTPNNMLGLSVMITQALDGQITLTPPE
jgi:hypothetical protein